MKNKITFLFGIILTFVFSLSLVSQNVTNEKELFDAVAKAKNGDVIKLEKKIYNISEPIIISEVDNLTIEGQGATIILESTTENVFQILYSNSFTMKNIKATHSEPDGPLGCTGNVVYIENCDDATFYKCDLNGCGMVGIAAYYCDNLLVEKSYLHKNSEYAIIYQGSSLNVEKTKFENNGNDNSIYFSYVKDGEYADWPPKTKINGNQSEKGITLKKNKFK